MDHRVVYIGNKRCALYAGANRCTLPRYDARIEYLENTGNQWIDTKIIANSNIRFVIKMYQPALSINYYGVFFFGAYQTDNSRITVLYNRAAGSRRWYWRFGSNNIEYINNPLAGIYVFDNYSTDNASIIKINDVLLSGSNVTFSSKYSITIFVLNNKGVVNVNNILVGSRLIEARFYNNNTPLLDLIPVRVGNVGYMFDTISGKLFGNAGTGDFIVGPDITD